MAKNYIQEGDIIDFTNGATAKNSGDVVVIGSNGSALVGISMNNVAASAIGNAAIDGVWLCPKVSAAVIGRGEFVTFKAATAAFDSSLAALVTGDVSKGAVAFESKGAGTTTLAVKLIGLPGILT